MKKQNDVVFNILEQMLSSSPEASYARLNPALRSTLSDCISADLPFQPDTFSRVYNELRGWRWFGDGAGSSVGEHYYTHAVENNHASAYQSFEQFAGRPAVLWEEDAKSPVRLHVGSRFTWRGYFVEVTSMRQDSLVACTYKDVRETGKGIEVGATIDDYSQRENKHWVITNSKRDGYATVLRVVKSKAVSGDRTVAKRFTITYAEMVEFRRTEKARLKKVLVKIASCNPEKNAKSLSKEIAAENFRHFQLEEINAAFAKRKDWIANASRIEEWRNGVNGAWLEVKSILLRVKDDCVECSNGNRVSLAAVRRVLPIILDRRSQAGNLSLSLDGHTINSLNSVGVRVGCTLVPWSEVDLIAPKIKSA